MIDGRSIIIGIGIGMGIALAIQAATVQLLPNAPGPFIGTTNPSRPMTRDDVICEPPNSVRLKPGPYTMASLEEMMQWCGIKIEAWSGAR